MTNERQGTLIGVDVGGTKIEGVLTDGSGAVLATHRVPARPGDAQVVGDIVAVCRRLSDAPLPVGIGIPGQVDSERGVVRDIVNLGIVRLDLAEEVGAALGAPVRVENDVNAAALGAAAIVGEPVPAGQDFVFLNFGTGLAAGVVRDGRVAHGASGAIGEIGHIPVDPNGLPCPCGQHGCLETVASGGAVARLWPQGEPPMPDLLAKAAAGDAEAGRVLGMVVHAIGDTVQIVIQAYDPAVIAIGGGMAKTGRPLIDAIAAELDRRAAASHFLRTLDMPGRLRLLPADEPIGAIGAALAAKVLAR